MLTAKGMGRYFSPGGVEWAEVEQVTLVEGRLLARYQLAFTMRAGGTVFLDIHNLEGVTPDQVLAMAQKRLAAARAAA